MEPEAECVSIKSIVQSSEYIIDKANLRDYYHDKEWKVAVIVHQDEDRVIKLCIVTDIKNNKLDEKVISVDKYSMALA
jgi:hypothetical protein